MPCPGCDFENPSGFKFCGSCGEPLPAGCASCGFENPDGFRFCGECGTSLGNDGQAAERAPRNYTPGHLAAKILKSRSALEGERKRVTVMFADVRGSMELAEQLDPEQWHRVLERFFEILSEGVHRFEGTVNQYTGDGIMALFGAPIAHEDHAQRACYAALQLRGEIEAYATEVKRQYGVTFSTRMGLHSGEVVVGKIGDDLRMDYTAQGHAVGLAQRMESLASPDTCYLTDATAQLVSGYFELEDLGEFRVKGSVEPMRVHRLVGTGDAMSRFDLSRARGLTRFVGRDSDMATLETALAHSQAGNGQVVGIVAEAGTGKSRLSYEFVERCRAQGITVNQGTGVAHGKNIPFLPMLQVFRGYYGIQEQDDDRSVREKIAGRMLLLDEAFREVLPTLFEFFGVPDPDNPVQQMDPDAKQRQIFSVLRRLVQGADPMTSSVSFITLIEDLHWLDSGSEAFLEQWVEAVAGSSSFLLVNFRPEYHADWMQKSYYRQLPLAPLGPDAIRELLDDLLGGDPTTRGLAEIIHQRTNGNPFFTEEVVQGLIESGHLEGSKGSYKLVTPIERLEVPASVQAVLAARIDRLPEREKQVLQAASVIGKEFSEPILLEAAELPEVDLRGALAALTAAEFVFEQSLYPVAEYAFKHPLTQEVALGSQLTERRQHRHAAVARAIEDAHPGKLDEVSALLAHHWEEAGEAMTASRWHGVAAEWVSRSDAVQGVRHRQRILALTENVEASAARDDLRLDACTVLLGEGGWRVGLSAEELDAFFDEGRELAVRAGSSEMGIALHIGYGAALGFRGSPRRYYELTRQAVDLIDGSTGHGPASAAYGPGLGYSAQSLGKLEEALQASREAVRLTREDPSAGVETLGFSVWGCALQNASECIGLLGDLEQGARLGRECIDICRAHRLLEALGWGLVASVERLYCTGEAGPGEGADEARRFGVEGVEVAERSGSPYSRTNAYRGLGVAHLVGGAFQEAAETLEFALQLARDHSGLEREANILAHLSSAYLGLGEVARAREAAEQAIAVAAEQGTRYYEALAQIVLAHAHRAQSGSAARDDIIRCLDAAQRLVDETGGRSLEPQIVEARARVTVAANDARELLARARTVYLEIGAKAHARRLEAELSR